MRSRYHSAVPAAAARQVKRSCTRWRAAAPRRARSSRVVQQPAEGGSQRLRVARRHEQPRLVVRTDDLGKGADAGGDQRQADGHLLDGRQAEALVERGNGGHLGRLHHLDELFLREPGAEGHGAAQAQLVEPAISWTVRLGAPDAHQVGVRTLDAQLGERVQQDQQALQRHVSARHHENAARHALAGSRAEDRRGRRPAGPCGCDRPERRARAGCR